MNRAAEPEQLLSTQYRDATQLDARIALHEGFSVNEQGFAPWLFEQLELPKAVDLLELGCGPAKLWRENAGRIPGGWNVRLSDFSPGMLDEAKARLADVEHPFSFEGIDAQSIPHADESFDCVVANHMLYHVPDRPRALAEIRRVLRPGGLFFASTLASDMLWEMGQVVRTVTQRRSFQQERASSGFRLEDGDLQLAPFFDRIEKREYVDALEVTETGPLLGYYRSMILDEPFTEAELSAIGAHVSDLIAQHGSFHVRKSSGVFRARRPD